MFQGSEVAACLSHKVAWLPDQDDDFWALVDGAGKECFWYCQKIILTSPENCTDDLWFFWSIIIYNLTQLNDVGNFGLTDTPGHSFSESGRLTRRWSRHFLSELRDHCGFFRASVLSFQSRFLGWIFLSIARSVQTDNRERPLKWSLERGGES